MEHVNHLQTLKQENACFQAQQYAAPGILETTSCKFDIVLSHTRFCVLVHFADLDLLGYSKGLCKSWPAKKSSVFRAELACKDEQAQEADCTDLDLKAAILLLCNKMFNTLYMFVYVKLETELKNTKNIRDCWFNKMRFLCKDFRKRKRFCLQDAACG